MVNTINILAQVTDFASLKTAVGRGLGIIMIFAYVIGVIMIIMAIMRDHGDGSWKHVLVRGIVLFAAGAICSLLFAIFYPGQNVQILFN